MAEKPVDQFIPTVQLRNRNKSVLILTADDTQDLEFFYPYYRLVEEGYDVDVVTPDGGAFKGKQGMGLKETKAVDDVDPQHYDLLFIPGGAAPAALKKDDDVIELVKRFAATGKPIGAFCHGPQVLAAAGLLQGRKVTAWPEVEVELRAVGAHYIDQPTVVDGQFITGRWPGDLPSYTARLLAALEGKASYQSGARTGTGNM